MPYFDLTANGKLLRASTREHPDIETIVDQAEYDLFDWYRDVSRNTFGTPLMGTTRLQTGLENLTIAPGVPRVMLQYYQADPADLTSDNELQFKADVQRAIAAMVEERVSQIDRPPGVKRERRGRREIEYFASSTAPQFSVPASARRYVQKYDIRDPV